jgi:pimeloyl-ACP methyl ester carboxylesterase
VVPLVLVHGGGFDSRCWEPMLPHLDTAALAVDLPGRGAHPLPFGDVTFTACAESVRRDVEASGFEHVILVGHSLAGCSMPSMIDALGERVQHIVFIACTVPDDGRSAFDMLEPSIQEMILASGDIEPRPMDAATAKIVLGTDLTDEQFAWCEERLVAEAPNLALEKVDLAPLRSAIPRTWILTRNDIIVAARQQVAYAATVGDCRVIDFDAGHMCMVSRPEALARILNDIAATAQST